MNILLENLVIIIVLYKCTLKESKTFSSLQHALDLFPSQNPVRLFIYDNSPFCDAENYYKIDATHYMDIKYVHDSSNPGVSKAYNQGFLYAKSISKEWVLLLDQDTSLDPNIFHQFGKAVLENKEIKLFAPIIKCNNVIFSPSHYFFKRGWPTKKLWYGTQPFTNKTLINSCMLINVDAFQQVGGYNENVYLDFSDTAFLEKFRKYYTDFYIIPLSCFHDASPYQKLPISAISDRYAIFCECAKNFGSNNFIDSAMLTTIVFLRALKLSIYYPRRISLWFRIFRTTFF